MTMQWNILGTGAIGCLIASQLRLQQHKVNLILRSPEHLKDFESRKNTITYQSQGKTTKVEGFTATVMGDNNNNKYNSNKAICKIENLVVATKAHHTAASVGTVVKQIGSESSVLLLQNGMGIAEELETKYWPTQQDQPRVLVGVNRHAVERIAPYHIVHHSGWNDPEGGLMMGEFFRNRLTKDENRPLGLEQALCDISSLQAITLSWADLRVRMLKKLVVNASINPLASILGTKNSGLANGNTHAINIMRRVCTEAKDVLGDDLPGETATSLTDMVIATCHHCGENLCSMYQDVKSKQKTEIDYINGYLCNLAKARGVKVPTITELVDLIHAKEKLY
ncbi:ketopantoate reductase PanE/ApbA C terminal-domain-containing protein [Chlamydoabsidia padenii]|nr:ketopantoate reductase PanE/ApbA C terminal-domain-containing protein [Chlamydoabsidia padenii]